MKVNGKMISKTEKVLKPGQKALSMKENML